ncbi:MAG: class I SAM-dependent methyltransferase [Thaumarchaeota archaeon]|nr:class I SAM-dependent methyltransferase [Nitrososphaerota archaeon]
MTSHLCRFCNTQLNQVFVDLGMSPLANSFLSSDMLDLKESFYPLQTFVCDNCFLVQLEEFESPENIFSDYAYFSSYSESWLKHAKNYVNMIMNRFRFDSNSFVIEIASNDGYLLQYFKKRNIPILGIEPAANIAKVAEEKEIPTLVKFFGVKTANDLSRTGKKSDLILGNNVLAHVPNLNDFVEGLKILLKDNGIITMEFPHLLQLMQQNQFDTIYHEHFSYFSLLTVKKIFNHHGLEVFDVEKISTHGGSLRVYVKHSENRSQIITENVGKLLLEEKKFGLDKISTYKDFQKKIDSVKHNIQNFFLNAKKNGKKIICYGAPAKGNTLLNYCKIGPDVIQFTVDRSSYKQGLYLPGTHIPIMSPEEIRYARPDYLVILPWNLKDEIMTQMEYIRNWDGKFVTLIPEVNIYS